MTSVLIILIFSALIYLWMSDVLDRLINTLTWYNVWLKRSIWIVVHVLFFIAYTNSIKNIIYYF